MGAVRGDARSRLIIDEYAELAETSPQASADPDSIARRGRAVAVTLIAATQRPTQKAMGQGALRSQMDVRVSFRVRERKDTDLILGQGMLAAGWHAHTLNAPGKFLISAPEYDSPRRARAYLLSDEAVARAATNYAAGRHRRRQAATRRECRYGTQRGRVPRQRGSSQNASRSGGRVTTAVLRDATHWDEVVTDLGYGYLRRHDLRQTGLTWMADAGVPVHVLRKIAGHGSLTTTQRYLHPDHRAITDAGAALSAYLNAG
jgi:hypothetical protein